MEDGVFARISRQIVSLPIYPPSRSRNHESGRGWLCTVRQWYTAVDGAGERKIKRWQKEWDGKGGREMKRRESVKKRAKKRSYRRWISAYTGFRAAMAVARWNIMLSHRLILSSRWNSRMSLSPPLVEKGNDWYVIFGYRVMMFPTLLIFLSFSFFWGRERERELFWSFFWKFLESNHSSHCPLVAGLKMQQKSLKTCYMWEWRLRFERARHVGGRWFMTVERTLIEFEY